MRNNETGEFELVVGNRQLLSGFAIVVLLFGVGVAMGYILGQNSPRSAKLQPEATAVPPLADSRPQPASPAAAAPAPQPQAPTQSTDPAAAPPSATGDAPAQAPAPTTQPARENPPASPPPQQPVVAAPSPLPAAPPGSYWQVMSLSQSEAEGVAKTLREQGFPTVLSPGPKNLTRVLVGPYKDVQQMGRAKTELERAGLHPVKNSIE